MSSTAPTRTATRDEVIADAAAVIRRARAEGPITILGRDGEPRGILSSSEAVPIDQRQERLEALPALVMALVAQMPACNNCATVATFDDGSGWRWCSSHAPDEVHESHYAPALRALIAGLEGL
jgi:hypothetical protein